jgi:hypothetical protein
MNLDGWVKCVELFSLKILFVVCLSLIIESGISCERGGDNGCSTRITEGVSVLLELILKCSIETFEEDGCSSFMKSIGTNVGSWLYAYQ